MYYVYLLYCKGVYKQNNVKKILYRNLFLQQCCHLTEQLKIILFEITVLVPSEMRFSIPTYIYIFSSIAT